MTSPLNPLAGAASLVEVLRHRATLQPDRLAYRFLADGEAEEATLTYAELDRRARGVAAFLQSVGAHGERVLLLYPASLDYVAAFYGCLLAGAVAVPAYPPRPNRPMPRIRAIVADAQARFALTTTAVLSTLERRIEDLPDLKALTWRTTDDLSLEGAEGWRDPGARRETLAFLQYTSGSTALPKGVMVSHGNLLHNETLIEAACEHSAETPCVSWLPLYHDLGLIGNMIQSLYVGTPCTLMSPVSFLQSPIRWLRAVSAWGGHTSGGPNFAYELCVAKTTPEQREGLDLSSWRVAFNGAEPVRQETLERFVRTFEPYGFRREALFPCYGLAETTLIVSGPAKHAPHVHTPFRAEELTRNRVVAASPEEGGADEGGVRELVGCGRILGGQDVRIVEPETLVPCDPGQVGEIWVAGPSVAQGYWNRPEETSTTFGARTVDGAGPFLRTGDLGFLWDGELYITGRLKDLIIIRGSNHYPQDIELTAERAHPALRPGSGAAFSVEVAGEERLVVVQEIQREHRRADVGEIAAAVRKAVADEHEAQLWALALIKPGSVPKTTSGKIQRRQTKTDFLAGSLDLVGAWREGGEAVGSVPFEEPAELRTREDVERWLTARLAALAGVPAAEIAPNRPLADHALDSLKAIELMHGIEARTGVSLPMESFFGGMTLAEVVDRVAAELFADPAEADASRAEDLRPVGEEGGDHPLSDGQRALWFLWRLEPDSPAYNLSAAVRLPADVDAEALRQAFQKLVERHPALRTTFAVGAEGEPVQRVQRVQTSDGSVGSVRSVGSDPATVDFELVDGDNWEAEAQRPFDLGKGPLFRVRLYRREPEPVLLIALHHIVGDFWSLAVMARELGALYAGGEPPTPELRFTDWVRWQGARLAGAEGERLLAWWRERLAGELPVLDLPTDRPRPPVQTYRGEAVALRIDPETTARLEALGRAHQATPFMTLLAGFQALLHRRTGQPDLLVGAPAAGRGRARLAGVVGYFVNPVVLRSDLVEDLSFADFLDRTRRSVLGAFEHQDYPFPTLVERLQPRRDPSRSPVFQAMFALQSAPGLGEGARGNLDAFAIGEEGAEVEVGGLRLRHVPLRQQIAQFDLTLSVAQVGGGLAATLDFNTDLFDRVTAERLATAWSALLAASAEDPARRISELPALAEEERRQVLAWAAAEEALGPADRLVHELFAEQAARTPEAVAALHGGQHLTYRELADRAAAVAAHLRERGVGPEDLVGICIERSFDLLAATLGVLQAGAAYVPIDPEAPAERRAWVGERVRLVLFSPLPLAGEGPGVRVFGGAGSSACLIYTSGSTGEPKGVILTHRNLAGMIASFRASYAPGPGDAMLPLTSVASASFVGEILPPLASGAAVVLPSKEELLDFSKLTDLIAARGVTMLSTVPSLLAGLNAIRERVPKLRLLLSGGEALAAGDVDRLLDAAAVVNGYGLTETSICSTIHRLRPEDFAAGLIPIGRAVPGHRIYVLDERLEPRPAGCPGELYIGGSGLARGYHGRPELTAGRFVPDPFEHPTDRSDRSDRSDVFGGRLYRTGDRARWRSDGLLEYLGRVDQQVKIRGFRIELGEIEAVLGLHPAVQECAVVVRDETGEKRLAAYVVFRPGAERPVGELLAFLKEKLPEPMIPAAFVPLAALPLNVNGKLDLQALPAPEQIRPELLQAYVAPRGDLERIISEVWREALKVEKVGIHDNFFDLGGHSLLLTRVHARLKEVLAERGVPGAAELSLIDLFKAPTVSALARLLSPEEEGAPKPLAPVRRAGAREDIAVIAVNGRFPGARNADQLWRNLVDGVESIHRFTDEELLAAGIDPELVANPNYIKAKGILGDIDLFDAAFFGHNPRSAELTDPQHRIFLECAWEALELAGWDADRYPGRIGVFAGQSMNTYWLSNLYHHIDLVASVDSLQAAIGNDKDSLTTEVSYRMNLKGPSVLVQSSSSTGLTAIHYACQSLSAGECDMAITGGASIHVPEKSGYLYHEGGTTDPDGHCRTFDADAKGFVSGHGVGVLVLKRLSDALADGDNVLAVIKGSACNNDGSHKVSYMAPSVDGHAEVVRLAQAAAGVAPETITYLEAHGTGTLLGDPVEIAGLTQAFRAGTDAKQFCAIGSLKTNIGHLDTAAGTAGLIKTVLCLKHRTIPPILHFRRPNPKIDFENSPFFVNTELRPWEVPPGMPRRAGISSLGMGGTNTHMVLEEAPEIEPSGPGREWQLLTLAAKTPTALENLSQSLAAHLREHPEQPLADIAWTLQAGRKAFDWRRVVVARSPEEAAAVLSERDPERLIDGVCEAGERSVAFLFSGQGAQYVDMGKGLYATEEVFRQEVDRCAEALRPHLGFDLREVLYPAEGADLEEAARRLQQTAVTQPALFTVEYALARLWIARGVRPQALVGHSIGEYVAACLAGVFELEDALALVAERGRLMQSMPPGAMLAVPLKEADLVPRLAAHPEVSLAAINRTALCVVSGPHEAIAALERELQAQGIDGRPLHTSHAFHSAMMDPILESFAAAVERVARRAPRLPVLSNVTGTWMRPEEAVDPAYWARQLRGAVRFADAVGELLREPGRLLLEVGPGNTLATAARQHPARTPAQVVLSSLRHPREKYEDAAFLALALGKLWVAGLGVDWAAVHAGERRLRVPLPTYPFERQRFWVEPKKPELAKKRESADLGDWFWAPVWKRAERPAPFDPGSIAGERWLILAELAEDAGLGTDLGRRLRELGAEVATDLEADGPDPRRIVFLAEGGASSFHALLDLAKALGRRPGEEPIDLLVVTRGAQEVTGDEELEPERAAVLGLCKVIPREMPHVACRAFDLAGRERWDRTDRSDRSDLTDRSGSARAPLARRFAALLDALIAEAQGGDRVVAWRGAHRWVQVWEPVRLEKDSGRPRLAEGGVYLLTGGLGGIGLAVAEHLALSYRAKLVLAGRSGLPERRVRQVRRLEELGAEVLVVAADSADRAAMARLREEALTRFGRIDGIFHAAGIPGAGLVATKTREAAEQVLAPKVHGTRVLFELFGDQPLSFVALFSSVTAALSQPGQADYAAANAVLDAWAHAEAARGGPFTVSVNWDAWQEVGMAVETEVPAELKAWREENIRQGVSPAQGIEALERALRGNLPQVAVSRRDFQARIDESFTVKALDELAAVEEEREVHARPSLAGAYVGPRDETETKIAKIWEETLGLDRVGIHDNFFDLGGNSLIGLKVISRVKAELQADLSPVSLFEGPTVASMAKLAAPSEAGPAAPPPALEDRKSRGAMRREKLKQRRA